MKNFAIVLFATYLVAQAAPHRHDDRLRQWFSARPALTLPPLERHRGRGGGQGAADDDAHCVVHVGLSHFVFEVYLQHFFGEFSHSSSHLGNTA